MYPPTGGACESWASGHHAKFLRILNPAQSPAKPVPEDRYGAIVTHSDSRRAFVVDKAARPGETAHLLSLRTLGEKLELEGLQAFHEYMIRLVYEQ
jgi:hypothetical protein